MSFIVISKIEYDFALFKEVSEVWDVDLHIHNKVIEPKKRKLLKCVYKCDITTEIRMWVIKREGKKYERSQGFLGVQMAGH